MSMTIWNTTWLAHSFLTSAKVILWYCHRLNTGADTEIRTVLNRHSEMSLQKMISWKKNICKVYMELYKASSYLSIYKCCGINFSNDQTWTVLEVKAVNCCGLRTQTVFNVDEVPCQHWDKQPKMPAQVLEKSCRHSDPNSEVSTSLCCPTSPAFVKSLKQLLHTIPSHFFNSTIRVL